MRANIEITEKQAEAVQAKFLSGFVPSPNTVAQLSTGASFIRRRTGGGVLFNFNYSTDADENLVAALLIHDLGGRNA